MSVVLHHTVVHTINATTIFGGVLVAINVLSPIFGFLLTLAGLGWYGLLFWESKTGQSIRARFAKKPPAETPGA